MVVYCSLPRYGLWKAHISFPLPRQEKQRAENVIKWFLLCLNPPSFALLPFLRCPFSRCARCGAAKDRTFCVDGQPPSCLFCSLLVQCTETLDKLQECSFSRPVSRPFKGPNDRTFFCVDSGAPFFLTSKCCMVYTRHIETLLLLHDD